MSVDVWNSIRNELADAKGDQAKIQDVLDRITDLQAMAKQGKDTTLYNNLEQLKYDTNISQGVENPILNNEGGEAWKQRAGAFANANVVGKDATFIEALRADIKTRAEEYGIDAWQAEAALKEAMGMMTDPKTTGDGMKSI